MPADVPKISFEDFIAKLPDPPSSAAPTHDAPTEAAAPEAEAPLADASADASAPPPAVKKSRTRKSGQDDAAAPPRETKDAKTPSSTGQAPTIDSVKAALRAGDLDTLADLLEEDPAGYDEKTPKWAARKRREAKIEAERDVVTAKAEAVVNRWSPVLDLVQRIDAGAVELVPELLRTLTNKDPDGLWLAAVRARAGTDPRVPALTARAQAQDARVAELEAERVARVDAAFYETLRDEVASDAVVRRIDEWESKVAAVLRESVDPDLGEPKLSVKQACARVERREREEFERRAAVFGEPERTSRKPRGASTPERASGASGAKTRKLTRDEWLSARQNG